MGLKAPSPHRLSTSNSWRSLSTAKVERNAWTSGAGPTFKHISQPNKLWGREDKDVHTDDGLKLFLSTLSNMRRKQPNMSWHNIYENILNIIKKEILASWCSDCLFGSCAMSASVKQEHLGMSRRSAWSSLRQAALNKHIFHPVNSRNVCLSELTACIPALLLEHALPILP